MTTVLTHDEQAYQRYIRWCTALHLRAATYEKYLKVTEKLKEAGTHGMHDAVSEMLVSLPHY